MSEAIKPVDTSASAQTTALWTADDQLDAQEIYSAEKQSQEFHQLLSETNAEASRGPVKDKMARLALLVAQKNLSI